MSPVISVPALEDFRPPYHLGAYGCALAGVWDGPPALGSKDLAGFEPMRWGGRYLGAAFVLRYDRPQADYPVAYSELIFAYLARRGAGCAAIPFDLVLDNEFYVDAGRLHYHLPKRLDRTLRIDLERDPAGAPRRMTASGSDLVFDAALAPIGVPCATGLASALLRGFTDHVPVIGAAAEPLLSTLIRVHPEAATAKGARCGRLVARGQTLRPFAALFWSSLAITVGVPAPLAR